MREVLEVLWAIPHLDAMLVFTACMAGLFYVIKNDNSRL